MNPVLLVGLLIAIFAIPAYLLYYYQFRVAARREEIRQHLTLLLAERYLGLFRPARAMPDDPEQAVLDHYDAFHRKERYYLLGLFAWLPSVVALFVVALWIQEKAFGPIGEMSAIPAPVIFALLGGWVWSLYEVVTRGTQDSLVPATLADVGYRILASAPLGYAFSLLVPAQVTPFVAFAVSAFPIRDVRMFIRRRALDQLKVTPATPAAPKQELLKDRVSGIGTDSLTRLSEVNITTVSDLGYADPIRIIVGTGLPLRRVIVWMDEALLAFYVGEKVDEMRIRGLGSALEASHFFYECGSKFDAEGNVVIDDTKVDDEDVVKLGEVLGIGPWFVLNLLSELYGDPHVDLISAVWGEDEEEEEEEEEGATG